MRIIFKRWRIIIVVLLNVMVFCCCTEKKETGENSVSSEKYRNLERHFQQLHNKRLSDSLLDETHNIFYCAKSDTLSRIIAATYAATEYLYTENIDSLAFYLKYLLKEQEKAKGHLIEGQIYKIAGFYEIKVHRNFYSGIDKLIKSYEIVTDIGESKEEITMSLANIVEFFYIKSDISGIYYARKAYKIAKEDNNPWTKYAAAISMGQMLSLSSTPEDALPYIKEADALAKKGKWEMASNIIPLVYAAVLEKKGDYATADSLYNKALKYSEHKNVEPYNVALVCLKYAGFLESGGEYDKAAAIYEHGIGIKQNLLNDKLYMGMARCASKQGNDSLSAFYLKKYVEILDSYDIQNKDLEANMLVSHYREMKQELELLEEKRKLGFVLSGLIVFAILLTFVIILNRRQKKVNRMLVTRYQESIRKEETIKEKKKSADTALWNRTEKLMTEDRIYKQKGLTLEIMAKHARTNRTYLSKAINSFSGRNFTSYLDSYRIKEAVSIIESSKEAIPFKIISDEVGYSNDAVFYKAFLRETGVSPGKYREEVLHNQKTPSRDDDTM